VTTFTVSNLTGGFTYYFAVAAYDTSGNQSTYSNEVSWTILQQYTLLISETGSGSGTVTSSPSGINCGTSCSGAYNQGTVVTLTALPATGSAMSGWSGGGCTGTGTCSLTVNANTTVTATFGITAYTITATAGAGGTISPSGATAVNSGASQTFTITPNTGYSVAGITVDGSSVGKVSSYTFSNVTANHTITATFVNDQVPGASMYTIWPASAIPVVADSGPSKPVELGVKFRVDSNGTIIGIRFYKASANTGTHVANLWTSGGTKLATATFTSETASGWQQVNFSAPVIVTANTVYVASYHTNVGHFSDDRNYFKGKGADNPPLQALANGVSGFNGVYAYGSTGIFPRNGWNSSNYWVDVVFQP